MAQSRSTWNVKGRRDVLNWDRSSSSGSNNQPNSSPTNRPATPNEAETLIPDGMCSWCGQSEIREGGVRGHVEAQGLGPAKVFCSDVCYSQCRRAAFKRAKVCDWCKHVRHTVSYVDLHDGQRQLQFCTDKCRNQYKMHLFCAEATSLGVQSCTTTPGTKDENSPGTSIDLKQQPTSRLITPDLWLEDCQFGGQLNVKLESSEEAELASIGSETDEQALEVPLNLVHSSRRLKKSVKRKSTLVESADSFPSKKGKSHRKMGRSTSEKTFVHVGSSSGLLPRLIPSYPSTAWPSFPYPPQITHPSYILPSQFLALNQTLKPQPPLDLETPSYKSLDASVIESGGSLSETITQVDSVSPVPPTKKTDHVSFESKDKKITNLSHETNLSSSLLSPNFVVLRIPFLVPLPIPVPIPIPLNIHEKYLKQLVT